MKKLLSKTYRLFLRYGFDGKKFLKAIKPREYKWFKQDFEILKQQKNGDKTFEFGKMYPILSDKTDEGGVMKGHYFHQDLYVARQIFNASPNKHLDIGSRTDGFVAHVASFREIEIIDIRNIESKVHNISFRQADLMKLPTDLIEYCDSISSLHAIEHFGLGRYGDPIDYFGYLKAIHNISKILIKGGTFYFSVPIGTQRIEFNAHRVFSIEYLLEILEPIYTIKKFSFVDDSGDFFYDIKLTEDNIKNSFNCNYGCGIFTLIKK
ncbi:MAG: DUF268 domain-containing protein [Flavobacteriaceae bacterium]|jgi:SAM-dependent methyltransferase|nr:DUF268 domain-containing protein [Flavobacteriaceae bacterium]